MFCRYSRNKKWLKFDFNDEYVLLSNSLSNKDYIDSYYFFIAGLQKCTGSDDISNSTLQREIL